jgi:NADH:ubiquinone oxidoreductase subunit F (NADH-binding)
VPDTSYRLLGKPGDSSLTTVAAYRKEGGYLALQRAVSQMSPEQVLGEIRAASLRGRGGGGVLTAEKMAIVGRAADDQKYVVCNAYDADPRSLISRTLLERSPHLVIEGIALAAYVVGAREAFLYMRADKALADMVKAALHEAEEQGVIGRNILGSGFSLSITQVGVDIGFMGGEESTLLQVIRGRPAKAQQRPPYPTEYGLFDKPTVVQNAETLSNLPAIVARGGAAWRSTGTEATPGTKLFTIIGPDAETAGGAVVEVPFGATIQDALRAAGMTANESNARGVAVGGMEGGVLPLSMLNTRLDYEPIENAGAIIGSSIIEVLPQTTCMVNWAMKRSDYLARESCGKCIPCRVGVMRIAGVLQGVESGIGAKGDLDLLDEFAHYVPDGSLCGFGVNAVHPVVTAMKYFGDDFGAHLDGRCPTGTCIPVRAHRYATKHVL